MNKIFEKPYMSKTQKDPLFIPPQLNTYKESLNQNKKTYNHITRAYIDYEPDSDDSIYEFESLDNELSENEIEEND